MEKVSAMKKIALFMMIVGLAVAMVACQGPVGTPGDKGDKGDKGDPGTTGTSGTPGFTGLQLMGAVPFVAINDIDATDDDEVNKVDEGEPQTIDLTDYIRGGTEPYKYSAPVRFNIPATGPDESTAVGIGAALVESGPMLKLSVAENGVDTLSAWEIKITDADGASVDLIVSARRNNAPTAPAPGMPIVGTQAPAKAPKMTPDCDDANECVATLTFIDNEELEMLTFTAESDDSTKVEVVSVKTEADKMAKVVLKGIASTWVADNRPDTTVEGPPTPGHKMVTVTVTATDRGGETVEGTLDVTVDGVPVAKTMPARTVKLSDRDTDGFVILITNVTSFFTDLDPVVGEIAMYTAETTGGATDTVATATIANTDDLQISPVAPGTTMVTVTMQEAADGSAEPLQSVTQTFSLTVTD